MDDDDDLPVELKAFLMKLNSVDEDDWKQGILGLQQAAIAVSSETTGENAIMARQGLTFLSWRPVSSATNLNRLKLMPRD